MNINPEKVIKNEELEVIRGGYGPSYLECRVNGYVCWNEVIDSCEYAREACNAICGSWTEAICVGW